MLRKILVVDVEKRIDMAGMLAHPWVVETLKEPMPTNPDVEISPVIDFRVIYTMVQALPEWSAGKILKAVT